MSTDTHVNIVIPVSRYVYIYIHIMSLQLLFTTSHVLCYAYLFFLCSAFCLSRLKKFFLINLFIYLFIYLWLHWVLIAAPGLSLVAASGGYSLLQCAGFSLQWLLLLQSTGSRRSDFSSCDTCTLERRLSSCGSRA